MKDIYVEFKGSDIKEDSRDANHKDTVEVYSWGHTMRQPKAGTASAGLIGPSVSRRLGDDRLRWSILACGLLVAAVLAWRTYR